VFSSPAIVSDGTIYVGSYDDYLYAIGGSLRIPEFLGSFVEEKVIILSPFIFTLRNSPNKKNLSNTRW